MRRDPQKGVAKYCWSISFIKLSRYTWFGCRDKNGGQTAAPRLPSHIMASERVQRRIDSLLDEAEMAIAELDWQVVQLRTRAVLALDSTNPDALNYLAVADRELSDSTSRSSPPSSGTADTIENQPTSFANGRYEVKRFLGEGGKKKVCLAQDTLHRLRRTVG